MSRTRMTLLIAALVLFFLALIASAFASDHLIYMPVVSSDHKPEPTICPEAGDRVDMN